MNQGTAAADLRNGVAVAGEAQEFVTVTVAGQLFGIPVLQVQDVLGPQRITPIPLAPPEVAGSLNLRGRIVTAINLRTRLKLPRLPGGELYSILVDAVGEVLSLGAAAAQRNPPTLDAAWRDVSNGIYRLDNTLMVILNVARVLDFTTRADLV